MKARIQQLNRSIGNAQAVTNNSIAIAIKLDEAFKVSLGDILEIDLLTIGEKQTVNNLTNKTDFQITIEEHNVHDLMLPANHRTKRFPTLERRRGA